MPYRATGRYSTLNNITSNYVIFSSSNLFSAQSQPSPLFNLRELSQLIVQELREHSHILHIVRTRDARTRGLDAVQTKVRETRSIIL